MNSVEISVLSPNMNFKFSKKIALYFIFVCGKVICFNFDSEFVQFFESNASEYFGYSVFLQKGVSQTSVYVGAPKGNSTSYPNVNAPGVVYNCSISDGVCKEYDVFFARKIYEKLDGQLFGNAIDGSEKFEGNLGISGQRWLNTLQSGSYYPNGAFYVMSNPGDSGSFAKLTPLSSADKQIGIGSGKVYYNYAFGEAGFSLHYVEDGQFLIGAPGVSTWSGTVLTYKDRHVDVPGDNFFFDNKFINNHDFRYLGYSVYSGKFVKNQNEVWYVSGAPRASDLVGLVMIIKYRDPKMVINGEQKGSYFGASVLCSDTNNDSADDLIVGAPMYQTKFYDEGCIYYYKNKGDGAFDDPQKICGSEINGARFGTALSDIGDINRDSYKDVAISAPYEDETGVVYIYLGNQDGLSKDYSQKIRPENFKNVPKNIKVRGFGFSISRGVDVDQNLHNDVAIGAYASGYVFIIKARPVVKYIAGLRTAVEELSFNEKKRFVVEYCLAITVTDIGVTTVSTSVEMVVDSRAVSNFAGPVTKEIGRSPFCDNFTVALTENDYFSLSPLVISLEYKLAKKEITAFCRDCPVNDPSSKNIVELQLPFVNECGEDEVCNTDLNVLAHFDQDVLILGTATSVKIKVKITNTGEPAYICQLYLTLPRDVNMLQLPSSCTINGRILLCPVDNVLTSDKSKLMEFDLDIEKVGSGTRDIVVLLNVTSAGHDVNPDDNKLVVSLPVDIDVKPQITWKSLPDQMLYVDGEGSILKQVTFTQQFSLSNLGKSALDVDMNIYVPVFISGETFLSFDVLEASINNERVISCAIEENSSAGEAQTYRYYTLSEEQILVNKNVTPIERTIYVGCVEEFVKCARINCFGGQLKSSSQTASIAIKIVIDVEKLAHQYKTELTAKDIVTINSVAFAHATNQSSSSNAYSILYGNVTKKTVPLWITILSALGGLALVGLIIYVMYKLNFFKRKYKERLINEEGGSTEEISDGEL